MAFHMHFAGNQQLRARQARTLNVLYGPNAKTPERLLRQSERSVMIQ